MLQFKIDYNRLSILLVPSFLRGSRILFMVRAAVQGVDSVYRSFSANRNANLYRLSNNSQVCYLEHVLNDIYDPSNRMIYINDFSAYGTLSYIYSENTYDNNGNITGKDTYHQYDHMIIHAELTTESTQEQITAFANTPILCSEVALATGVTTFNVMIANTSSTIQPVYNYVKDTDTSEQTKLAYRKFCALINTYKLAGKKYKIVPYTPKTTT